MTTTNIAAYVSVVIADVERFSNLIIFEQLTYSGVYASEPQQ